MSWIYLFQGVAEPLATGIKKEIVYAVAQTEDEAISKCSKVLPGNYRVSKMKIIAELAEFGSDVYAPEDM